MKTPIERMLENVEWAPVEVCAEPGLPYATHRGVLVIADVHIKCWRLNTGEAVIDPASLEQLFPGWEKFMTEQGHKLPAPIKFQQP